MGKRKVQNGKLIKLVGTSCFVVSFCGKVYGDKYEARTSVKVDRTLPKISFLKLQGRGDLLPSLRSGASVCG